MTDADAKAAACAGALGGWLQALDAPPGERELAARLRLAAVLAVADTTRANLAAPARREVEEMASRMAAEAVIAPRRAPPARERWDV